MMTLEVYDVVAVIGVAFLVAASLVDHARLVRLERMYLRHLEFHRR